MELGQTPKQGTTVYIEVFRFLANCAAYRIRLKILQFLEKYKN